MVASWRWALFRSVTSTTTAIDAEWPSNVDFEALTSTSTMLPSRARMVEAICTGAPPSPSCERSCSER